MNVLLWVLCGASLTGWARAIWLARRRRVLVTRACHEVRGPLTVIGLAAHGRAPGLAAVAEREVRRAGAALDDLSLAPRGARRREEDARVDMAGLLREEAATWAPVAAAAGTRLQIAVDGGTALVRGDRLRLAQITSNLIANAIEHGDGAVRLSARADERRVRIDVGDDGPGPVAPGARRRVPGGPRGHGLQIAADLARRHGGRLIRRRDAEGRAVLTVDLPRAGVRR